MLGNARAVIFMLGLFGVARKARPVLPDEIALSGRGVRLLVREHANARRIVLRLSPCGTALKLTVPPRTPVRTVLSFLERHKGWAESRLNRPGPLRVEDGAVLPFRGGALTIRHEPSRRGVLVGPAELLVGGEAAHLARRVKDALVREARSDLEAAVARHASVAGLRPAGMSLRDTVSRWGSCSAARRLSFSWRIVLAPPHVLDYLAAHEVAHLREMNHGPAFWALCRELCPSTDEGRAWLKTNGASLHAIDFS